MNKYIVGQHTNAVKEQRKPVQVCVPLIALITLVFSSSHQRQSILPHSVMLGLITRHTLANGCYQTFHRQEKFPCIGTCSLAPSPEAREDAQASLPRKCEEHLENSCHHFAHHLIPASPPEPPADKR